MKILGKRILNSNLRFTFEVDGEVTPADGRRIKALDAAVCSTPNGNATSLSGLAVLLGPLVDSEGEVRVAVEPIE